MDSSGTVQRSVAGSYEHCNETSVLESLFAALRRTRAEGVRQRGAEKVSGSKEEEIRGNWRKLHNWRLNMYTLQQILLRSSNYG
jgi:hypothetical protein